MSGKYSFAVKRISTSLLYYVVMTNEQERPERVLDEAGDIPAEVDSTPAVEVPTANGQDLRRVPGFSRVVPVFDKYNNFRGYNREPIYAPRQAPTQIFSSEELVSSSA